VPYIPQERRYPVRCHDGPLNAGELTYVLYRTAKDYFESRGGRYQQIAEVMGALAATQAEFYRRIAAPYEDKKREENGDV
jgi:hypothetical protein